MFAIELVRTYEFIIKQVMPMINYVCCFQAKKKKVKSWHLPGIKPRAPRLSCQCPTTELRHPHNLLHIHPVHCPIYTALLYGAVTTIIHVVGKQYNPLVRLSWPATIWCFIKHILVYQPHILDIVLECYTEQFPEEFKKCIMHAGVIQPFSKNISPHYP